MVKLNVVDNKGQNSDPPDIFIAAQNDDKHELRRAIQAGQSLDDIRHDMNGMTPLHFACKKKSLSFLEVALTMSFDPWIRDGDQRLAIDHAWVNELGDIQKQLHLRMYPNAAPDSSEDKVVVFPAP